MKNFIRFVMSVHLLLLPMMLGCGGATAPPLAQHVTVTLSPSTVSLAASETQQFTATVTNTSNTAVTWAISGCSSADCGAIDSGGLYTAPAFIADTVTVKVVATSASDSSKSQQSTINLMPISVSVFPWTTSSVVGDGTRNFTASVQHDPRGAGVTWAMSGTGCSADTCGTLTEVTTTSLVYHSPVAVPVPPIVRLTATSKSDNHKSAEAVITIATSAANSVLQGSYAFLIRGRYYYGSQSGPYENIAGHLEADGYGNLTGIWDVNRMASVDVAQPITGSYEVLPDGQGTLTIYDGTATWKYNLTVDAMGTFARLAEDSFLFPGNTSTAASDQSPDLHVSSGYMEKQDAGHFDLASVKGDRVIALTGGNVAALGRFTADASGSATNGVVDLSWQGGYLHFFNTTSLTGSFGAPDTVTGRGTARLIAGAESRNFAYYVVSDQTMLLAETDARDVDILSGEVRYQKGAGAFAKSSLNAPVVFSLCSWTLDVMTGIDGPRIAAGRMSPNGSGLLTTTFDQNEAGEITANSTIVNSYSVSSNGRVTIDLPGNAVAYLVDQNTGFLVRGYLWGAAFGPFQPQTDGDLNVPALKGNFMVSSISPPTPWIAGNDSGLMTISEDGAVDATFHINTGSGASTYNFSGTFTVESNGRGTMFLDTIPPSAAREVAFWTISPTHCVAILTVNSGDTRPVLLDLQRSGRD